MESFNLKEIADWQLNSDQSHVELPSVQRGFVWKPKQVEDLWDSILRAYPIGSLLFSRMGDRLYLMDGQQRSTAIFLGHFNPFSQNDVTKAWSIKGELPVLWVDIKPHTTSYGSKYLFRLITRSHPWGYQASNNEAKLSEADRRQALQIFQMHKQNTEGYTSFKNDTVFPFDCSYPVPLCFLLASENVETVISKCELYLPDYFSTKKGDFTNKTEFIALLKSDLSENLKELFNEVTHAKQTIIKSNIIEDKVLNEENDSENPTLFVRINSAGTALTADDLIYSIYKSTFPDAKHLIEHIGLRFIAPTQVLSLVSRIVSSQLNHGHFIKKLSVRDFQRNMKNEHFKNRLKHLVESGEIAALFEKSIRILSCEDNELFNGKIPPVLIKQFIKKNQELYLFFLYWLYIHDDKILDNQLKLRMVAKMLFFSWFGFDNLPRLWSEKIKNENFWDEPLNNLLRWDLTEGTQLPLPPQLLRKYYAQVNIFNLFKTNSKDKWDLNLNEIGEEILNYYETIKNQKLEISLSNEFFRQFIVKIQYNKQLIIFAQRAYLNEAFVDFNQMEEIEDTNVPWDWDHIYPSEWVYRKVYCNSAIKDWNNTNGNLRAIALDHNRSRGNQQSPHKILSKEEREFSFINETDWLYWQNIENRIIGDAVDDHFKAITTRMINIYEKCWDDLKIADLIKHE